MKLLDFFKKKPYYFVPECPACGSPVTGRYLRQQSQFASKIIMDGLNNGEIIKIAPGYAKDRCFCLECNHEWEEHIPMSWFSIEEICKEIEIRRIRELQELIVPNEPQKKRGLF